MDTYFLRIELLSDTCFSRGDGVAGYVDIEIKHDQYGMPYVDGRTLKGLLSAACGEILDALALSASAAHDSMAKAAKALFGAPGSSGEKAKLRIGMGSLPQDLRVAIMKDFQGISEQQKRQVLAQDYLEAFTTIRRQTAMDESGAPRAESLRSIRLLRRGLIFDALLESEETLSADELLLLAACARTLTRVGSSRNRGSGKVKVKLLQEGGGDLTDPSAAKFIEEVLA